MKKIEKVVTYFINNMKNLYKPINACFHNRFKKNIRNSFGALKERINSIVKCKELTNMAMTWSTIILAIATVVLAIATWRNTDIVRNDFELQYRPCLFLTNEAKFGKNENKNNEYCLSFVLCNSGRSSANDVTFEFARGIIIDSHRLGDGEYMKKLWEGEEKDKEIKIEIPNPVREKSVRVFPQQVVPVGKFILKRTDLDKEYNDRYDIGIEFTLSYKDSRRNRTYIDGYHAVFIKDRKEEEGKGSLLINSWEIK